jgi:hypothetical protein
MADDPVATAAPWWATWWGRLLSRCGLTLLSEAEALAQEKNRWQRQISDALDMTVEDHGTWYIDLDRAVTEIRRLRNGR